ncbi:hypothetical protein D3C72_2299820 [compost metagenome]
MDGLTEIIDEVLAALKLQIGLVGLSLRQEEDFDGALDGARGELPRQHAAIAGSVAVGYAVDDGVTEIGHDHEAVFVHLGMAEFLA